MPILDPDSIKAMQQLGEYSTLGIQMVGTIILFGGLGWWADHSLNTKPWGMLIGCLIGIGGGLFSFIRAVQRANKEADKQ